MQIIAIQNGLKTLGYDPGILDGLDGPITQSAVARFQEDEGITADGIFGPETTVYFTKAIMESPATAHFQYAEYRCDCENQYCSGFPAMMDYTLLKLVENLRQNLGRPVIITSGVRCDTRNAEVGGIAHSKHKKGLAADLYCPGVNVTAVAAAARDLGLGVIVYEEEQFVHVEV